MSDIYARVRAAYVDRVAELGLAEDELWEAGLMAVYELGRFDG